MGESEWKCEKLKQINMQIRSPAGIGEPGHGENDSEPFTPAYCEQTIPSLTS